MVDQFKAFKKEMEQIEAEARVKEKDWASILKEEMGAFKMDLIRNVKTL